MKKLKGMLAAALAAGFCILFSGQQAYAAPDDRIEQGVRAGDIDLAGMTKDEAAQAIQSYVDGLGEKKIELLAQDGSVSVTAAELGIVWENEEILTEAVTLGKKGNIVARYKAMEDLKHRGKNYEIQLDFDRSAIASIVEERCMEFNVEAIDAQLKRVDGNFAVEEGQTGYLVDQQASASDIYEYMTQKWNREDASIVLAIIVDEPRGKAEELLQVKDLLGSFTTSYVSSGRDRSGNVTNGCAKIDGTTLYPGDTFSTYDAVKPFSQENGYFMAGSYLNGKVVDSIGGGICQVSTTLYNAVLQAELEVTERHNHSMIVNYVDPSADAAIAESAGKDFRFVNNTEHPVYIEGYTEDKRITFNIYGVESRDAGRTVVYESKVLEKKVPERDTIVADPSQPVGYIHTSAAHIGYRAELWKVVKENGVEVSREQINSSNYQMSPQTVTVGTATSDPNFSSQIQAAIETNDTGIIKGTIANIKAAQEAAAMTPEQLAELAAAQAAAAAAAQAAADAEAGN